MESADIHTALEAIETALRSEHTGVAVMRVVLPRESGGGGACRCWK